MHTAGGALRLQKLLGQATQVRAVDPHVEHIVGQLASAVIVPPGR
jgi:hypothetical protein